MVVSQVRSKYASKNDRLKRYEHAVWDIIEHFSAFSINWIERSKNIMADFLANVALKNDDATLTNISTVEIKSRPPIPDNVYNWQVFANDEDILRFIQCIDDYDGQKIDCNALVEVIDNRETVFSNDLFHLETNEIPKGLVELEGMFNYNDSHLHQQSTTKLEEL